jgi:Cu/Ag efflux pump CusA
MLGLIVIIDDSIVSMVAVTRRLREPLEMDSGKSAGRIVVDAIQGMRGATTYAFLVVVLAMLPLLLFSGVGGAFLPPMLAAYLVAALVAMVVAVTLTPALSATLLAQAQSPQRAHPLNRRITSAYWSAIEAVLRRSRSAFAVIAIVTVAALAAATMTVGAGAQGPFVPQFSERDLLVAVNGAPGTSATEMNRIAARAGAELRQIPGVRNVGGHVGRAVTSDQVVGVNAGILWISIDQNADHDSTVAAVRDVVAGYPGLELEVGTYTSERIGSVLEPTVDDVVVRVYGQDATILRAKAAEVSEAISGIDGLTAVAMQTAADEPTLQIEVDLATAERLGLKPGDVRRATTTLLSGLEVGLIFEEQKVFEVVVWGVPELRESLSAIRELPIRAADGSYVPLGDVARVEIAAEPSVIEREGVFRYVDVGATLAGRDLGAVLADVDAALAAIEFPFEYRAEVSGAALERQDTTMRVLAVAIGALIGILLLFQAAFLSWRRAGVLLLTLPAALIGVLIGVALLGEPPSISVIAGSIAVLAFAIRHSVLMVARYQRLEHEPGAVFDPELIAVGAQDRLAPTLMAAAVISLALAPFVLLGDAAGLEILRPMSVVALCGVATSTLFALFVVPVVVFGTGPSSEPESEAVPVEQPGLSPA